MSQIENGDKDQHSEIVLRTRVVRHYTVNNQRYRLTIRIDVIDNGPGIPAEISRTLFYPMVTGRPDGTGLGLSISQQLINQHGGLIECQSKPGCTVFSVFLPIIDQDDEG